MAIITPEMAQTELARRAKLELARRSFEHYVDHVFDGDFIWSEWNKTLCKIMQRVGERMILFFILSVSPRWGKTELIAKLYVSWNLGNNPSRKNIVACYEAGLASDSSRAVRTIVQSDKYKVLFPKFSFSDKREAANWETEKGGGYYGVGIGGALTGRGFDDGIIDDFVKNREDAESLTIRDKTWDWYTSTFSTRSDEALTLRTSRVIFATRWNIDDLVGRIEERAIKDKVKIVLFEIGDGYKEIDEKIAEGGDDCIYKMVVPALNEDEDTNYPERFGNKQILDLKSGSLKSVGIRDFSALYMQDPIKSTGAVFKSSMFKYFTISDFEKQNGIRKDDCVVGIFVDPAFSTRAKSDDVCIMALAQHKITKDIFVLDIIADTIPPSHSVKLPVLMAQRWKGFGFTVGVISVEDVSLNKDQSVFCDNLEKEMINCGDIFTLHRFKPRMSKEDRIKFNIEPFFERGALYFRTDTGRDEFVKLEEQLLKFPVSIKDDIMDTLAQGLEVLNKKTISLARSKVSYIGRAKEYQDDKVYN